MSDLSPAEVARLARLARLEVGPEEAAALARDVAAIAASFSGLAEFAATLPSAPEPEPGALRPDEATPSPLADAILAQAPHVDGRRVRAPGGAP